MNTRKAITIALILMLAMALAACGETASTGTQNPETSSQNTETSSQDTASNDVADGDMATDAPPAAASIASGLQTDREESVGPKVVIWTGIYEGDGYVIEISEEDSEQFYFVVKTITTTALDAVSQNLGDFEGWASFNDDNVNAATGDGIGFYIYDEEESVMLDFLASESSEWAYLRGTYEKIDYDDAAYGKRITEEPIAEGVVFGGSLLEGDPGENMTPYEAASGLYYSILASELEKGLDYSEELPMSITCVDVVEIGGEECYLLSVSGAFNTKAWEFAVSYDYDSQNVYLLQDGETTPLGSLLDLGSTKAYE